MHKMLCALHGANLTLFSQDLSARNCMLCEPLSKKQTAVKLEATLSSISCKQWSKNAVCGGLHTLTFLAKDVYVHSGAQQLSAV